MTQTSLMIKDQYKQGFVLTPKSCQWWSVDSLDHFPVFHIYWFHWTPQHLLCAMEPLFIVRHKNSTLEESELLSWISSCVWDNQSGAPSGKSIYIYEIATQGLGWKINVLY